MLHFFITFLVFLFQQTGHLKHFFFSEQFHLSFLNFFHLLSDLFLNFELLFLLQKSEIGEILGAKIPLYWDHFWISFLFIIIPLQNLHFSAFIEFWDQESDELALKSSLVNKELKAFGENGHFNFLAPGFNLLEDLFKPLSLLSDPVRDLALFCQHVPWLALAVIVKLIQREDVFYRPAPGVLKELVKEGAVWIWVVQLVSILRTNVVIAVVVPRTLRVLRVFLNEARYFGKGL